jgi:CelD/BcsL family acetyltransferase involved in cellulose biosynthesis
MRTGAFAATAAPPAAARVRFSAQVAHRLDAAAWRGGQAGTAFQAEPWLAAWYGALAVRDDVEPLLVTVRDGDGRLAAHLPLVRVREGGRRVVEFADLALTDFNAPLLGPAAPADAAAASAFWRAVARAVRPADLVRLRKMPPVLEGRPNPMALVPGATPCAVNGNVIRMGDDYDAWRHTLARPVRMDLERSWRVFARQPGTRFARISDLAEAHRVLAAMEAQQAARMRDVGAGYALDTPFAMAFYRGLLDRGLESGFVVLTALLAEDEVVAGCLSLREGGTAIVIRLTNAAGAWSNCSPGRLVLERTLHLLHGEGMRTFDFSVGNQDYKRRFGIEPTPLVDLVRATGLRGMAAQARAAVAGRLRARPILDRAARRLLALKG